VPDISSFRLCLERPLLARVKHQLVLTQGSASLP
jgi:hypothetical protein